MSNFLPHVVTQDTVILKNYGTILFVPPK